MKHPEIHKQVLAIAWPMILAGASVPLLGIVDTAILGHLDEVTFLSAVAVGASALSLLLWLLSFLRMGTTGLVARAWGGQDNQQCRELLWQSLSLALVLGVLLILLQQPVFQLILWLLGPSDEIRNFALEYCHIRIWAAPAALCSYAAIGWLLGLQRARQTLVILATTNIANIGLDFFFIMGLDLNSAGAAWASLLAEYIGVAIAIIFVRRELKQLGGDVDPRTLLQPRTYKRLLTVNRDLFIRTACVVFTFTFFTAQGARLGDEILAVNAILMQLVMLTSYGLDGIAHAAESLTGHAVGAKDPNRFRVTCGATLQWGGGVALMASLAFFLFQQPIIALFTSLPEVVTLTNSYYGWLVLMPLLAAGCFILDGVFLGADHTHTMRNIMFVATALLFLPAWWLAQPLGNHGLWLAFAVFMAGRSMLMTISYRALIGQSTDFVQPESK